VSDNVFEIDLDDLTINDIETIEEITGHPIDKLADPNMPKGKMLRAMAFIKERRVNPDATPESVGDKVVRVKDDKDRPTAASVS
jgi:hypothetical protein